MALPATQSTWAAVIFTLGKDARGEIHCRPGRWGLLAGRIRPVLWVIPGIIREVQSKMGTEAKLASGSLAEPPGSIESNRSAYDLGAWERWRPGWRMDRCPKVCFIPGSADEESGGAACRSDLRIPACWCDLELFDKKVPLQPWRDMARHGETIEFIQSLCRWRLADRAEGGAMVAAGC